LRHKATDLGLNIRSDGFVAVGEVLAFHQVSKFGATELDLRQIVQASDKQRFEFRREADGQAYIRAVQGHSMKVVKDEELMRRLSVDDTDLPVECVHGTFKRHVSDILEQGLKAGGKLGQMFRNHVHFAPHAPGDKRVISGMRCDSEVVVWVNLREALRSGIPFFLSQNNVILTPGIVPPRFFERVLDVETGADLLCDAAATSVADDIVADPKEPPQPIGDAAVLPPLGMDGLLAASAKPQKASAAVVSSRPASHPRPAPVDRGRPLGAMGGRGKGAGGKGTDTREACISKALSAILRHTAPDLGLNIRTDGFVAVGEVLALHQVSRFNATEADLQQIVQASDKQRFELKREADGQAYIRAVHGHSMKIVQDEELTRRLNADDVDLLGSIGDQSKGAGGKGADTREVRISKALSTILRHKATDLGLNIRSDGFVAVGEVLAFHQVSKFGATELDLRQIVQASDKQRFEFRREADGQAYIRAVQGHSMKVVKDEELMRRLSVDDTDLPVECVHGTFKRHVSDILEQGLKAGGKLGQMFRNHVHFAPHAPGDKRVISGMRCDSEVVVWVNLREALRSGIPFFLSQNNVILTPGIVPPRFFERVLDVETGADLLCDAAATSVADDIVADPKEPPQPIGDAAVLPPLGMDGLLAASAKPQKASAAVVSSRPASHPRPAPVDRGRPLGAMGGRGKGAGGKGTDTREACISKALSAILRHTAPDLGLNIRTDGFVAVGEVLALHQVSRFNATEADLHQIVQASEKQRFELRREANGREYIRAV